MNRALFILGFVLLVDGGLSLTWSDKSAFYQNCEIFNNTDLYGGPVCGSNGVTYANSLYLDCVNYHEFENVATVHTGECRAGEDYCKANIHYEPVCGTDGHTYSNLESLLCNNYMQSLDVKVTSAGPCEQQDDCNKYGVDVYGINPVCGSNGLTYQNVAQLKCMQRYNEGLKVLYDGGCDIHYVFSQYGFGSAVCQLAKTRYEWNPVCGSDGSTYQNPFVLLCYKPEFKVASQGICGSAVQNSCVLMRAYDSSKSLEGDNEGARAEQVCGSDGDTYSTVHHLQCATFRDKYLFLRHAGACSGPDDNPCGSIPQEDRRVPVCGSDGRTYVSPEALWCGRQRSPGKKLTFVHDGPC